MTKAQLEAILNAQPADPYDVRITLKSGTHIEGAIHNPDADGTVKMQVKWDGDLIEAWVLVSEIAVIEILPT